MTYEEFISHLDKFYRENNSRLVKTYTRFIQNQDRAEDIIQEAYVRALTYWDAYDQEKPFDKWFNSIISSCLRDNKRIETMHGMVDIKEAMDVPIKPAAIPAVILDKVMQRIDKLPETEASVLRLTLIQHYRPSEIANLVKISANAIRQIVFKFREEIRKDYRFTI